MAKRTQTSSFGTTKREAHDASAFYGRSLYEKNARGVRLPVPLSDAEIAAIEVPAPGTWADQIYCKSSERMEEIPDNSVGLAFTSPPYNVGKDYDEDLDLDGYLNLIANVGREVYRVLRPGGRYIINIANLGRKPYIPLNALFFQLHMALDFLPMGEIIWRKAKGAGNSTAWGSWMSA
ncbi:MAG TPA: DNA methyltransferase, partial [Anaerolineales bacterium]|nr:DNA methyltransferase [Anaerolineales bacterium]